jgi:hypothetical protein
MSKYIVCFLVLSLNIKLKKESNHMMCSDVDIGVFKGLRYK